MIVCNGTLTSLGNNLFRARCSVPFENVPNPNSGNFLPVSDPAVNELLLAVIGLWALAYVFREVLAFIKNR